MIALKMIFTASENMCILSNMYLNTYIFYTYVLKYFSYILNGTYNYK